MLSLKLFFSKKLCLDSKIVLIFALIFTIFSTTLSGRMKIIATFCRQKRKKAAVILAQILNSLL
jgi:hypothetical protein